jgi:hypothetical protein
VTPAKLIACAAAVASLTLSAADADAGEWRVNAGPFAGGVLYDAKLDDYRWDTGPAIQSGVEATLYRGRIGVGARVWRASTTQSTGIPGETFAPSVRLTSTEMTGAVAVFSVRGVGLWGTAHGGRLHLGYSPDHATFDVGGSIGTVSVDYKPVTEWIYGAGVALRGDVTRRLALSVAAERSSFALDTAHRAGGEVVESRERFANWALCVQLSWVMSFG